MKNIFFLFMVAMLTITASCNKENPEPEPTCGEPRAGCVDCEWNVFRCKVNGEEWCANCEGDPLFGCDPVDCQFYPDDKTLSLRGGNDRTNLGLDLYSYKSVRVGEKSNFTTINHVFFNKNAIDSCILSNLDTLSDSYLIVNNLDTVTKIIEGTFEFTAFNKCQDTIRITDGYFKLSYRP